MQWWEILLGIILFIVALGVLIGVHELGHLAAAKAFHVYCFNYSIGFGPKLLSTKKSEKHETTWSLRAVPLGGFVSMYGEGMENETGEFIPPSRSLEGVARYKRAIIVSAGVFLNFVLGFVLILLHNGCFDHIYFEFKYPYSTRHISAVTIRVDDELEKKGIVDGDSLDLPMDPFTGTFFIQDDITLSNNEDTKYILCMSNVLTTTKIDPLVSSSLYLYVQQDSADLINESINKGFTNSDLVNFLITNRNIDPKDKDAVKKVKNEVKEKYTLPKKSDPNYEKKKKERDDAYFNACSEYYSDMGVHHSPSLTEQYNVSTGVEFTAQLTFHHQETTKSINVNLKVEKGKKKFNDIGVYMMRQYERYDGGKTFQVSWNEWCGANTAVFRGLGMLFTGQGNVSGPIGIAQMSTNILANFGFERYLYLWGMISCNLAILNLLPFPGLDGWTLVVIAYEGLTKKQIPTKVKGLISLIGLGLLFFLMIFIIIKDIVGLI